MYAKGSFVLILCIQIFVPYELENDWSQDLGEWYWVFLYSF